MQSLDTLIVIPARYHSSRFPGKPLAHIAGTPMLQRVWDIAQSVSEAVEGVETVIATEDQRIIEFCQTRGMNVVLTSDTCQSGTERVKEVLVALNHQASFILNFQGDNALCPPWFLTALIKVFRNNRDKQRVITPYVKLSWPALDHFRQSKAKTPFSGTTVVFNQDSYAMWFSKQILPAIRNEESFRTETNNFSPETCEDHETLSPVCRHIGLYGYHRDILLNIDQMRSTEYETLEGLEQLAFIENSVPIKMVQVDYQGRQGMSGIDSPEDVARAEAIIKQYGEILEAEWLDS